MALFNKEIHNKEIEFVNQTSKACKNLMNY